MRTVSVMKKAVPTYTTLCEKKKRLAKVMGKICW
jgi:hypothetical protein